MAYEYTRDSKVYDSTCFLIKPISKPDEDGIIKPVGEEKREVFCQVSSVYWKEFIEAYTAKIKPQWKLIVFVGDYEGEMLVEFQGKLYNVYRSFFTGDNVELYLRVDDGKWKSQGNGPAGGVRDESESQRHEFGF